LDGTFPGKVTKSIKESSKVNLTSPSVDQNYVLTASQTPKWEQVHENNQKRKPRPKTQIVIPHNHVKRSTLAPRSAYYQRDTTTAQRREMPFIIGTVTVSSSFFYSGHD
jgi:hypothetical protein